MAQALYLLCKGGKPTHPLALLRAQQIASVKVALLVDSSGCGVECYQHNLTTSLQSVVFFRSQSHKF
jgi:hypothetical protein